MQVRYETTKSKYEVFVNPACCFYLASAMSAGHVRRLRDEEPDLYTVVFENADGTNTAYFLILKWGE